MSTFVEVMGELKAALDEHDRLTQPDRAGDNPQLEDADLRNRLPDPMEEVEENHTADALEVSDPRAPSPPSTIQGGGGIGGS